MPNHRAEQPASKTPAEQPVVGHPSPSRSLSQRAQCLPPPCLQHGFNARATATYSRWNPVESRIAAHSHSTAGDSWSSRPDGLNGDQKRLVLIPGGAACRAAVDARQGCREMLCGCGATSRRSPRTRSDPHGTVTTCFPQDGVTSIGGLSLANQAARFAVCAVTVLTVVDPRPRAGGVTQRWPSPALHIRLAAEG